jgi:hypothetical protein
MAYGLVLSRVVLDPTKMSDCVNTSDRRVYDYIFLVYIFECDQVETPQERDLIKTVMASYGGILFTSLTLLSLSSLVALIHIYESYIRL